MPNTNFRAGRFVPASPIDFSRSAKNMAWLLECPLHEAQKLLAQCYGFGSLHELQAAIPAQGELTQQTGPFDEPRRWPPYFADNCPTAKTSVINELQPLSPREGLLLHCARHHILLKFGDITGRASRRFYALLDGAFFSAPAVHRKKFAELKAGILAMESSPEVREQYLEQHWPPAFWSYLAFCQQMPLNAHQGLHELRRKSVFYTPGHITAIGNMFHATTAYRAPAIFLEMAGAAPANETGLPDCTQYLIADTELPSITPHRIGLFEPDMDGWATFVAQQVSHLAEDDIRAISQLAPEQLAEAPPPNTPEILVTLARKWRLHSLRQMSQLYVDSPTNNKYKAMVQKAGWPSPEVDTEIPAYLRVPDADYLGIYAEFQTVNQYNYDQVHYRIWKFNALLTRDKPDCEETVGYMTGWFVELRNKDYTCMEDILYYESRHYGPMLHEGIRGFLEGYFAAHNYQNSLEFVNDRELSSVAISEVVLCKKYRKSRLLGTITEAFTDMYGFYPNSDYQGYWSRMPIFNKAVPYHELTLHYDGPRRSDYFSSPPGVFMIPASPINRSLRSYLNEVRPQSYTFDEDLHLFPFNWDESLAAGDK